MMYYDVFNERVGTISSHTTLKEAEKSAKKYAKMMKHYFTIFKRHKNSQELVKWVFPKGFKRSDELAKRR